MGPCGQTSRRNNYEDEPWIAKRALGLGLAIVICVVRDGVRQKQSGEPGAAGGQRNSPAASRPASEARRSSTAGVTDTLNTLNLPLLMDGGEINKYATGLMFLPLMELDSGFAV